jgi:hypothetical protein
VEDALLGVPRLEAGVVESGDSRMPFLPEDPIDDQAEVLVADQHAGCGGFPEPFTKVSGL